MDKGTIKILNLMKCKEHLCLISHSTDLAPFPGPAHSERANVNNVKKSQRQISNILNVSMCFIWENTLIVQMPS